MSRPRAIDELGWSPEVWSAFDRCLRWESGVILLVGMRGSGLTTTTYAALQELRRLRKGKIVSIEDPVERLLDGIEQLSVDSGGGFIGGTAIDEAARRDPVVIATGVLIDRESAQKAFAQAELGRLVLASFWGPSAEDAVRRLIELCDDRDVVHRQLRGILRQELIEGVCEAQFLPGFA